MLGKEMQKGMQYYTKYRTKTAKKSDFVCCLNFWIVTIPIFSQFTHTDFKMRKRCKKRVPHTAPFFTDRFEKQFSAVLNVPCKHFQRLYVYSRVHIFNCPFICYLFAFIFSILNLEPSFYNVLLLISIRKGKVKISTSSITIHTNICNLTSF